MDVLGYILKSCEFTVDQLIYKLKFCVFILDLLGYILKSHTFTVDLLSYILKSCGNLSCMEISSAQNGTWHVTDAQ